MQDRLRILTCGSVDDGQSTLIARLLFEAGQLHADAPASLAADSRTSGMRGIGLDVAYRCFSTSRRNFVVADIPGHLQCARNIVAGASSADVAIVLIDARQDVRAQTRRLIYLLSLLRVRHLLLAVNTMDLVGYAENRFRAIEADYRAFVRSIGFDTLTCLPVSALEGDNLLAPSARMAWHSGPTLLEALEAIEPDSERLQRGERLYGADAPASVANQFRVTLIWMNDAPLLPGRAYQMKLGTTTVGASITQIRHEIDLDTLGERAARQLELDAIGVCNLATDRPIAFDPYADNRDTSGFILIDPLTNDTVGAGLVQFALRRAQNIHLQAVDVDKAARARQLGQKPRILWFTGLSGAGKSSIANAVERRLHALGRHTYLLDGDNVRHGLNRDLGFTDAERVENIRRVAEVARLMLDAGLIVLVSLISPFASERRMARAMVAADEFVEIFVDAPLAVAEARDPKGLYAKARRGELPHFTGIDSPYEVPQAAQLRIDAAGLSAEDAAERVLEYLAAAEQPQ